MNCFASSQVPDPEQNIRQAHPEGMQEAVAAAPVELAACTLPPRAGASDTEADRSSDLGKPVSPSRYSLGRAAMLTLQRCLEVAPLWTVTRLGTGIAAALQPVVYGKVLGAVLTTVATGVPVTAPAVLTAIAVMGAAHLVFQTGRAVDAYAQSEIARRLKRASEDIVSGVLFSRYGDAIKPELAGRISRVRDNLWRMERVPQALFELVGASGTLLLAATTLASAPAIVGVSIGLSAALPFVAQALLAREAARDELAVQGARQRSWYKGWFLMAPEPARELITSQSESAMRALYRRDTALVEGTERKRDQHRLLFEATGAPLTAGGAALSLSALLGAWAGGQISIGDVAYIFGVAWPIVTGLLVQISQSVGVLSQSTGVVSDLNYLRGAELPNKEIHKQTVPGRQRVPDISVNHLSFSYAEDDKPVLREVSLEIPAGSYVGLVGSIGAGKSTLCQLLAGLLRPTSGQIMIDGVALGESSLRDWYGSIAYCYQDPEVFQSLTLREYITLGQENVAESFVHQVSNRSGLSAVIADFPLGWDTPIGGEFSGGRTLSGGERQLLAFTRALCRRPAVLLLDEPTANLNPQQAERVLQMIESPSDILGYTPTRIFVSHNLRHLSGADRLVLAQGQGVVVQGTYEELLSAAPEFAAMVRAERGMGLPHPDTGWEPRGGPYSLF